MKYLLILGAALLFGGVAAIAHFFFPKKEKIIVERVLIVLAICLFVVRFMCYDDIQVNGDWRSFSHLGGPQPKFVSLMAELCIWLVVPANLFIFLRAFSKEKTGGWFVKFISLPILIACIACLDPMLINMTGEAHASFADMKLVEFMLPIELGASLALTVYYFIKDFKIRIAKTDYLYVGLLASVGSVFAIPPFLPNFLFGEGMESMRPYDLTFAHRIVIYVLFIILPLFIYFFLRNKTQSKIKFALIFLSLGIMFGFMYFNKFSKIDEPWTYPFHLCNTAVFILPICFIFKPKRLFYFTYFINVFGALMATLMPNYGAHDLIFNPDVVRFIMNHMTAFWMPLLAVALKVYDRPKMKQYFYSLIWLVIYFVLMLFLNVYFNAHGHETDFFFLYTDKVAAKFGGIGKKVFEQKVEFTISGIKYTIRPLFQSIFLVGYMLLGFAMWFVYQLGFDISDSHYALHLKLKGIRQDKLALESVLDGRSIEEPMEKDAGIKLKLEHFSKKYGMNKHYSVHDASFEVNAGEVFGFLGPNGAGKSTTIKSIVGIQPITEGKITVCGYDVKSQSVQAKAKIGFVPDHYALYEKLTGREYINYIADIFEVSKEDREERIARYVKLFELEASIDNKIKTYSHGMKQKITIISALVHNPKVWILDEPLTGLDPTSIFQVKQCIKKHAEEGNIVFFSSHLIDIVEKLCDRVAIIKHGEIQAVDTVSNIEKKHGSLEKFYLETIGDNVTEAGK